jgi:hypothetical protein
MFLLSLMEKLSQLSDDKVEFVTENELQALSAPSQIHALEFHPRVSYTSAADELLR